MALDAQKTRTEDTGEAYVDVQKRAGVTVRSVLLGLGLVVGLDVLAIYVRYIFHGSLMTYSHIPMSMLIVFTLMMMGAIALAFLISLLVSLSLTLHLGYRDGAYVTISTVGRSCEQGRSTSGARQTGLRTDSRRPPGRPITLKTQKRWSFSASGERLWPR